MGGQLLGWASLTTALELRGTPRQGALIVGVTEPGARVHLDGQPVRVTEQGEFVIGFERDAEAQAELVVVTKQGNQRQILAVAPRDYRIQQITGVPQRTVTRSEERRVGKGRI